jgi:hypothetical protein
VREGAPPDVETPPGAKAAGDSLDFDPGRLPGAGQLPGGLPTGVPTGPPTAEDIARQAAAIKEALAGIDTEALRKQLETLVGNLPASLDDLKTWLPGAISQVGSLDPDLTGALTDLKAKLEAGEQSAEALRESARRADASFKDLADRLKTLDPSAWARRGPMQDPGTPQSGRRLFPTSSTDDKARGESWARSPRRPSLTVKGGAGAQSSVSVGEIQRAVKGGKATGDPIMDAAAYADLLARNPEVSAAAGTEVQFRSKLFDLSAGMAAGASGSADGQDAAAFYREHRDLPGAIKKLAADAAALDVGKQVADVQKQIDAVRAQTEAIRGSVGPNAKPGDYLAALQAASETLKTARQAASQAGSLISGLEQTAVQAQGVAGGMRDQTRHMTVDMAGGAVGRVRVTGRVPIKSPGAALTNLTLAVTGQAVYTPRNPMYDPANTSQPQFKYTLGAIRSQATVWIEGTDRLKAVLADAQKLSSASRDALSSADRVLADLQTSLAAAQPAAADAAAIYAEIEKLQGILNQALPNVTTQGAIADPQGTLTQLAGQLSSPEAQAARDALAQANLPELLARIESLRKQIALLPVQDDKHVAETATALDRMTVANQALLADLDLLDKEFRVKADVTTRVVQPTFPLGGGVGVGLSGTLHVGHPVDFALTADNLAGYMPGKEEVWRLKDPTGGSTAFEKVSDKARNVYGDFFPPTYRLALASTFGATTLRADWEKVQGLPGVNQLYGLEQGITNYVRVRGGVEKAPAYGRDWAPYAGLEVGPGQGWAVWMTGSANSFSKESLSQGSVSAGLRIDF